MLKQKSALIMICVLLGMLFFAACKPCCKLGEIPPGCVICPGPTTVASAQPTPATSTQTSAATFIWKNNLDAGDYATVIAETTQSIDEGKDAPAYAQALLYRGAATLKLGTNLEAARDDLALAQKLVHQMSTDEQTLLFRSQMVVLLKLGDNIGGEQAFQQALKVAPEDQKEAIRAEYKNATSP